MNLIDYAKKYEGGMEIISDWLGHGGATVSQDEAQRRADICLLCPQNDSGIALTEMVAAAIKRHLEFKNKIGLRVAGEKRLHTCAVCKCPNKLQLWCPSHFLTKYSTPADLEKYPEACWKRHPEP